MKWIYATLCILGTILPCLYFIPFVAANGLNMHLFLRQLFANQISSTFAADVLVSSVVLWTFIYHETRTRPVRLWWLPILGNLLVGVSLGLPLFLLLREGATPDSLPRR